MPFMIKVIFVGHKDDGTVETSLGKSWDPPPFGITFIDITGNIDANGTTYEMKYCGLVNGTAYNQVYDSIPDGLSFDFVQDHTLEQHLADFEAKINKKYLDDRQIVIDNYLKATNNKVNLSNTAKIEWRLIFNSEGAQKLDKIKDFGKLIPLYKQTEGYSSPNPGSKEGGVAQLIDNLMKSSSDWTNVQISGNPQIKDFDQTTTRYSYKVSSEFAKTSSLQDNRFIITYYIDEYSYKVVDVIDSQSGQGNALPPDISKGSVYTFNYIFTGRNIDIQKLDMNLSMGYALWVSLVTSAALPTQTTDVAGTSTNAPTVQLRPLQSNLDPRLSIRTGTPIWPTVVAQERSTKELTQSAAVASADAIWRNFASYQAIQTELSILGNPSLIQKITNPNRDGPDYVKINIKMPSTTDDIWEYEQSNNNKQGGYYKTFWFDGYYNIITAKNKFIGGQFTQDLNLIGIPQVSSDMIASASQQAQEDFNIQNPSSTTSTAVPKVPTTPNLDITPGLSKGAKPTQASSPKLPNVSQPQLSYNFVSTYWNSAVSASTNYAATASQQHNTTVPAIDPDFVMAQAAVESGWGTNTYTQYGNLTSITAIGGPTAYWDGSAAGRFRAYGSAELGLSDNVRLVTTGYSNVRNQTGAAYASDIQTYAYDLQSKPGGGSFYVQENPSDITSAQYQANVIAAYNQIQIAKAHLGIVGKNLYANAPVPPPPTSPMPYLASTTTPATQQVAPTPTVYSATDRTVIQAELQQKTPVKQQETT